MTCNTLSTKDPSESVVITFDFTLALNSGETLASVVSVTPTVTLGTDPAPTAVLNGTAAISGGTSIQQPVHAGIDATNYFLKAIASTSAGRVLALSATLPVRAM